MITPIKVKMAEYNSSKHPSVLTTLGLGSCIGVCLYDTATKTIGMAHIMLPDSTQLNNNDATGKFADSAIPLLVEEMRGLGCSDRNLVAKIAGGSQMFATLTDTHNMMRIGERNTQAVRAALAALNIPLVSEDTGGTVGRTIILSSDTGLVNVRKLGGVIKDI